MNHLNEKSLEHGLFPNWQVCAVQLLAQLMKSVETDEYTIL